ncbi:hypothetical protein GGQ85_003649 [Nitrobacter vulgaris]|nr:hypothetical protein [Nitrobacter vulgaris]
MNAGQIDGKWFFAFRQISSGSPGGWVLQGPFDTYDQAMAARQRSKNAYDAEVSSPFAARSRDEAQGKCDAGLVA